MNQEELKTVDPSSTKDQEKFKMPIWVLGIGLIFPPVWPFLLITLVASYPKLSAILAGSAVALVGGGLLISMSQEKSTQEYREAQQKNEERILPSCLRKYGDSSKVPSGESDCLSAIEEHERKEKEAMESAESSAKGSAEFACRKAVKNSLATEDGFHIPLGSVVTAAYAGHSGQYVTKFPFTVKNAFGVKMKHAVECVATGDGSVLEVNQLF
jgi:hypothetical protein